ncbi:MAG: uncharacterized protein KVP18_004752 [Porospora cf. gigantea A]|uniref:uncharacterized protein n=1 Tax=Porospora cf. gigantea A TaxID=2853593 RepID=UPI003559496D|nr:MAG: hypothetical protein KVP18_004752 [Porospora cf. gigantea A]
MTRWNVSPEPRQRESCPAKDSQNDKDARREEFWKTVQTLITKKLCVQCRRQPFFSDKHLVCKDCTRRLKLEECVHCGEEFYSAKPSQGSAKATNAETERVLVERRLREELERLDRLRKEQEDVISELQEQRSAAEKKAKHQYHKARKENQQLSEHLSTYKTQTLAKTEELFDWLLGSARKVIKEKAEVEDRLKEVQARLERSDSDSRPLISDSVSEQTETSDEEKDPASTDDPVRETDGSALDDTKQLPENSEEPPDECPEPSEPSDSDATETPDEGAFD